MYLLCNFLYNFSYRNAIKKPIEDLSSRQLRRRVLEEINIIEKSMYKIKRTTTLSMEISNSNKICKRQNDLNVDSPIQNTDFNRKINNASSYDFPSDFLTVLPNSSYFQTPLNDTTEHNDIVDSSNNYITDIHSPRPSFKEQIASWAVEDNISLKSVNRILSILKNHKGR